MEEVSGEALQVGPKLRFWQRVWGYKRQEEANLRECGHQWEERCEEEE